ncbi:MAG: hypothetical protein Q9183_006269, partial [Haloplaca sp. 2 TL-2023]
TWDPRLFGADSENTVRLFYFNGDNRTQIFYTAPLTNDKFSTEISIAPDFLHGEHTNLTLYLHATEPLDDTAPSVLSGPIFVLNGNATNNGTSEDGGDGDKDIGKKAGIPVGLGVFLIAVAGLIFFFLRRRKNKTGGYMSKRSASSRMTGDGGGFRDEPTRGLELQDRNGHGRQDSWEAGWDTSSSQGGGGNAFRDEIDRQRRR